MDIDEAKSILIANLKGSKRKRSSLITIAKATRLLLRNYRSTKNLAEDFDVSRPIIESFDKINDQPEEIKKLIAEGKILLDASTKLSTISDITKRIELANAVAGLTAFDTRYVVDYWKKHPELSAEKCKRIVLNSKSIKKVIHVLVIPLEAKHYNAFQLAAKAKGLKSEDAARLAIMEWLEKHNMGEKL